MPTFDLTIATDGQGKFSKESEFDPPLLWDSDFRLFATLEDGAGATIKGEIDVDAVDGSMQNDAKPFELAPGRQCNIGIWKIDTRRNRVVVRGETLPSLPNAKLRVKLDVRLA
jgi:hypothetical protein